MFDLKRPCVNCPFRKGQGELFQLSPPRLEEIRTAVAFQCHKTVDYAGEDREERAGSNPLQCAGLMAVLHREGKENQIMQVAHRFGQLDYGTLDPQHEAYETWNDVLKAHGCRGRL